MTPFYIKNCSVASIATGERAGSLLELRDKIAVIDEHSIYYHFWGARTQPQFIHTQHHNDFAAWAYHHLHDQILAEKLGIIDPTEFENLSLLRQELLDTIDSRLEDYEIIIWKKRADQFFFIRSILIIFDSPLGMNHPDDLSIVIAQMPPNSIFYHFIDARTRTEQKTDDFSVWLQQFGKEYEKLIERIQAIDPYFLSLTELKEALLHVCS